MSVMGCGQCRRLARPSRLGPLLAGDLRPEPLPAEPVTLSVSFAGADGRGSGANDHSSSNRGTVSGPKQNPRTDGVFCRWWRCADLNRGPNDYESFPYKLSYIAVSLLGALAIQTGLYPTCHKTGEI